MSCGNVDFDLNNLTENQRKLKAHTRTPLPAPPCYLQACEFQRVRGGRWERGLARVECWGVSDVQWIIDLDGNKIGDNLYDYSLTNHEPGHLAKC